MEQTTELFPKVFTWLFIGLLITFVSGYALYLNESLLFNILSSGWTLVAIFLTLLVISFLLNAVIYKLSTLTVKILYIIYCFFSGLTFSSIFIVYEIGSIISIFLVLSLIFAALAVYGHQTHRDLTNVGTISAFTLLGIICIDVINMFIGNSMLHIALTSLGIFAFMGFTIYDVQKIKNSALALGEEKAAVRGAFNLLLDFINLLLILLQLFGKKND